MGVKRKELFVLIGGVGDNLLEEGMLESNSSEEQVYKEGRSHHRLRAALVET